MFVKRTKEKKNTDGIQLYKRQTVECDRSFYFAHFNAQTNVLYCVLYFNFQNNDKLYCHICRTTFSELNTIWKYFIEKYPPLYGSFFLEQVNVSFILWNHYNMIIIDFFACRNIVGTLVGICLCIFWKNQIILKIWKTIFRKYRLDTIYNP